MPTLTPLAALLVLAPPPAPHYAVRVDWSQHSSCSRSWAQDRIQSSLVLDLTPSGEATACRGAHGDFVGGGWRRSEPPTRTVRDEQQGYRGRWRRDGADLVLRLMPVADVCPTLPASRPGMRQPWLLRCRPARAAVSALKHDGTGLLACRLEGPAVDGRLGLVLHRLGGPFVLLGPGSGVVAVANDGDVLGDASLTLGPAQTRIGPDAWRSPTPAFSPLLTTPPRSDGDPGAVRGRLVRPPGGGPPTP